MPRYRLTVEYDGGPFEGWQSQANGRGVQDALESAIATFCGERVRLAAAGRTDAGVHASGQVVHMDLQRNWPADTVQSALNAHLRPAPVAIVEASVATPDFHARFSATRRRYLYRILDRRAPPALARGQVWHVRRPLDAQAMAQAAGALLGQHDFTTFRHVHCQSASPVKTLDEARVERVGDEVQLAFVARSFLHRQVRSMTGTLAEVGAGRWTASDVADALAAADRARCGPVAPAEGLCLTGVDY